MRSDLRRAQILIAAIEEFGPKGLEGTPTQMIATRAGVSQPYLFRLFSSKNDLFTHAFGKAEASTAEVLTEAAESVTMSRALPAMQVAFEDFCRMSKAPLMLLQALAASHQPDIRDHARAAWRRRRDLIVRLSGASDADARSHLAWSLHCCADVMLGE